MAEPRSNPDAERDAAREPIEEIRYPVDHVVGVVDTLEELTEVGTRAPSTRRAPTP